MQIDELVVQALENKVRNENEVESFANVLHEMQNTLKVDMVIAFIIFYVSYSNFLL